MWQAFSSLAEAAYEAMEVPDEGTEPETYSLSSYFEPIVQKLLETTERWVQDDGNIKNFFCIIGMLS